jgi:hypothetical protein
MVQNAALDLRMDCVGLPFIYAPARTGCFVDRNLIYNFNKPYRLSGTDDPQHQRRS